MSRRHRHRTISGPTRIPCSADTAAEPPATVWCASACVWPTLAT